MIPQNASARIGSEEGRMSLYWFLNEKVRLNRHRWRTSKEIVGIFYSLLWRQPSSTIRMTHSKCRVAWFSMFFKVLLLPCLTDASRHFPFTSPLSTLLQINRSTTSSSSISRSIWYNTPTASLSGIKRSNEWCDVRLFFTPYLINQSQWWWADNRVYFQQHLCIH